MELNTSIELNVTTRLNPVRKVSISENVEVIECSKESIVMPGLKKDAKKLALLIYLYFLQGIPLGLCGSIPFLLSARGVSYADQGTFSFAFWPFSIKLLWAPFVDSLYFKKIGRRKTWLVPVQLCIAFFMFLSSSKMQELIDSGKTKADIILLTVVFAIFITLAATQDIAVDGWAISILSRENVSWQATCNFCGQVIGYFVGYGLFIVLESAKFSNKYFRPLFGLEEQAHGLITLKMFMTTFGCVFLLTAIVVAVFIREENWRAVDCEVNNEDHLPFFSTYKMIWEMLRLIPIRKLSLIVLTYKIGWATDSVIALKMIEHGVSKEKISLVSMPLIPVMAMWPLCINKITNGSAPILFFSKVLPIKLILSLLICSFVYFVPNFRTESTGEYGYFFFLIYLVVILVSHLVEQTMSLCWMSFFSRISDERLGGTYMTYLTTLSNLGGSYPGTTSMFLINWLTQKYCDLNVDSFGRQITNATISISTNNRCSNTAEAMTCKENGGECITTLDAFYYLSVFFYTIGFVWILSFKKWLRQLDNYMDAAWKLPHK